MEKYINMNDSFGGKNSISSTKSFQTSYEECIETLQQQLQNHKQALLMAQKIVEQYKEQNHQLLQQNILMKQSLLRSEQKYEVLEKLLIKLDNVKEKEIIKQNKKSRQKYQYQIESINSKYQTQIEQLNQQILFLENQVEKYQERQAKYQSKICNLNKKNAFEGIQIKIPTAKKIRLDQQITADNYRCKDSRQSQLKDQGKNQSKDQLKSGSMVVRFYLGNQKIRKTNRNNVSQNGRYTEVKTQKKPQKNISRVSAKTNETLSGSNKKWKYNLMQNSQFSPTRQSKCDTHQDYPSSKQQFLKIIQKHQNPQRFYESNASGY